MDREQAQLLKDGSAVVALYLRGDKAADATFNSLAHSGNPDPLLIVSLVAEESWAVHTGARMDEMWDELPGPSPAFPSEMINRPLAVQRAKLLREGPQSADSERGADREMAVVLLSALDLALASLDFMAEATEISASAWCHNWSLAAAASLENEPGGGE
jgi:hypothetical protein